MTILADVVAAVLILLGAALSVTAAIGLLRFPDVLTRIHAQTKPAVLGLLLILAGTALHVRDARLTGMVLLVGFVQLATAPVGGHMIGRAAFRSTQKDDGADATKPPETS